MDDRNGRDDGGDQQSFQSGRMGEDPGVAQGRDPLLHLYEDVGNLIGVHHRAPDGFSGPAFVELCLFVVGMDKNLNAKAISSELTYPDFAAHSVTRIFSNSPLEVEEGENKKKEWGWKKEPTKYRIPYVQYRRSLQRVEGWALDRSTVAVLMEEIMPEWEEIPMYERVDEQVEGWLRVQRGDAVAHALLVENIRVRAEKPPHSQIFPAANLKDVGNKRKIRDDETTDLEDLTLADPLTLGGPRQVEGSGDDVVRGDQAAGRKSARARKADGPTRRTGRESTGPEEPRRAGAGTEGTGRANTAPNGCEVDSSQEGVNQPSERSDGDIRGGHERSIPPVEGNSAEGEVRYKPNRERWKTRGTIDQRRYLDERARSPAERLLYLHLLSCARSPDYDTGEAEGMEWVGVSAETMEEEMGAPYHSTRQVWEHSDLIEADPDYVPPNEDGEDGRTRRFRIPQPVLNRWAGLGDGSRRWWLHTEKPERTSPPAPMSTDLSGENNHRYPDLIDRALRVWVDTIQPIRLVPIKEAIVSLDEKNTKTARAQKSGLQLQLRTINRQTQKVEGGVAHVRCAYTPTFAGRIVFKNGGPQGMLGAVKARAYDIKGLTNYDIRSCHTTGLKQVADKLADVGVQIDVSPWEEYPGKYAVAEQTGLPVILVKTAEHAVKYGAVLPSSAEQVKKFYVDDDNDSDDVSNWPSVAQAAERYAADVDSALSTLHDVFSDMRRVIKKIADALLNDYYDATQRGGYMHNPCGVSFNPRNYEEGHERRSKVMAWMLQGLEAAFIHSLTLLSVESDDFNAVANEHDGLIAEGTVPPEAVEVARLMSGFYRAELIEKPHADAEEIAEVYGREEPEKEETVFDRDARYHAEREIPQLTAGEYEEMRSGSDPMPPDPAGNAKSGPRRRQ
jgi:hypothetical protein